MCCRGCDEHLSSLLQGPAKPLVICPSSRRYRLKVSQAIKTLTKIEHWTRSWLRRLAQLAWSVASVPCIMVSQRRSGNTKMRKWKGIESYQDARLINGQSWHSTGSDQHLLTTSLLWPALVTHSPSAFASCLYLREMGSTGKNKKGKGKAASGGESARSEAQICAHNNYYQKWVQIGFLYILDSHSFDSHKEEISIRNKQKCACAKWVFVCRGI